MHDWPFYILIAVIVAPGLAWGAWYWFTTGSGGN